MLFPSLHLSRGLQCPICLIYRPVLQLYCVSQFAVQFLTFTNQTKALSCVPINNLTAVWVGDGLGVIIFNSLVIVKRAHINHVSEMAICVSIFQRVKNIIDVVN